jgi:hypothetical protein
VTEEDKDQWRLDSARRLKGTHLQFRRYSRWSESWDHDHCAACGAKFAESDEPGLQREGYTTCDDYPLGARYEWVCTTCFEELKDRMQWTAVPATDA